MTKNGLKKRLLSLIKYFTVTELLLWGGSVLTITLSYILLGGNGALATIASLIGVSGIIFTAKGNPIGQALFILFSLFYAYLSHLAEYYGEMITYIGMTLPMSVVNLVGWLRHPYEGRHSEVAVARLKRSEIYIIPLFSISVTVIFYFILGYFNTANLIVSTISVATSFTAAYLTFRRSPYFALAYALNDVVLITLWAMEIVRDTSSASVLVCFAVFLFNDIYTYISWRKIAKKQGTV